MLSKSGVVYKPAEHGITKPDYSDMMAVFKKFLGKFPEFNDLQITELHGGDIFVTGGMERDYDNGFLAIGDAAFQINPLGGEGSGTDSTRDRGWPRP